MMGWLIFFGFIGSIIVLSLVGRLLGTGYTNTYGKDTERNIVRQFQDRFIRRF